MVDFRRGDTVRRINEPARGIKVGDIAVVSMADEFSIWLVGKSDFAYLRRHFVLVSSKKSGFSQFIAKVEGHGQV